MKKIFITFTIALSLLMSGCADFLKEKNEANVTTDEYYATVAGFNSLLNATYSSLRSLYNGEPLVMLSGTDLYMVYYARDRANDAIARYQLLDPNNSDVKDFYDNCFAGIGLSNAVLHFSTRTATTNVLKRQVAEARFIRAYYYFHLVQQFGGVALVKEMTTSVKLDFPRNTEEEVWAFIIEELEAIKADLPTKTASSDYGRVDQRTVNHFLAKSYLTRGWKSYAKSDDFNKAQVAADAAINNYNLSALTFANAYAANPAYAWRNDEVIWSINYHGSTLENATSGTTQGAIFGGYLDGVTGGNKSTLAKFVPTIYAHYLFTKDIADPNKDVRYDFSFMNKVYDKSILSYYTKSQNELNNTEIKTHFEPWWKADFQTYKTEAEWKAAQPNPNIGSTFYRRIDNPGNMVAMSQEELNAVNRNWWAWGRGSNTNYYFPSFKKFDSYAAQQANFNNRASVRDVDMARVSESMLIAAEACIKMGQADKAAAYINNVRRRAIDASDAQREIAASKATIDFVLEERARELLGQYDRWYDLARTGTLIERAVRYNSDLEGNASWFRGADGNNKVLRPIPQTAIDANNAEVTQNPGY